MADEKKQPVARVSEYPISAAVWRNEKENGDVFYNFTLQRSYKDDKGEYHNTDSFGRVDALVIEKVVQRVFYKIGKLREIDINDRRKVVDEGVPF
jgi:hypothetical protein